MTTNDLRKLGTYLITSLPFYCTPGCEAYPKNYDARGRYINDYQKMSSSSLKMKNELFINELPFPYNREWYGSSREDVELRTFANWPQRPEEGRARYIVTRSYFRLPQRNVQQWCTSAVSRNDAELRRKDLVVQNGAKSPQWSGKGKPVGNLLCVSGHMVHRVLGKKHQKILCS